MNAIEEIYSKLKDRREKDLHDEERCCNCYLYGFRFCDDNSKPSLLQCLLCGITCGIFNCIAECCATCQNK